MNLAVWMIFGIATGLITNWLDPSPDGVSGIIGSVILGVSGAVLGGIVTSAILGMDITGFNLTSVVIATLGSLLILFLSRAMQKQ